MAALSPEKCNRENLMKTAQNQRVFDFSQMMNLNLGLCDSTEDDCYRLSFKCNLITRIKLVKLLD